MKHQKCIIGTEFEKNAAEKEKLIRFISDHSNKHGDKLVEFMDLYHLYALNTASVAQLQEYIATHLTQQQNSEKGRWELKKPDNLAGFFNSRCRWIVAEKFLQVRRGMLQCWDENRKESDFNGWPA